MGKLQIGTSGWVYKHWMNIFYPAHCKNEQQLSFYAQHFSTVEINFSFYKLPERSIFESWRAQTPEKFIFAVKGSRYLTHMKKLKDPTEPLSRLMERASGLQEKLGPILFQFPHTWHINIERLQPFLELLQTYPQQRFTFEFRHSSWLIPEVYKLLERAGVALCLPVSSTVPLDVYLTTPWTYIRMHQGQSSIGYSDEELTTWAERIRSFLAQGFDVYVYFNNDPDGYAIRDAQQLQKTLI
ncbi:DUF72 domain-containing protein [Chlorogloeopsis fritschii PCC 9212]|uniref:Histidine kinase n=1 Tax=Chlorogloeopsis fritschii PCC 6912 TaxID=211165 RepID=A0A3S0ZNZ3_CHLFR|nr:DUF72 domain-containing protein [Chlorogloeopsis fritschii]RUR76542.1 hypothetical protein PCC6912_43300 [Chlorogloeopsis fritschii PCC 6912]